ncbi:MAG TPA: hypothetical protein VGW33_11940 [Terriglobia bacterium]|nr:hypothetical protein [Terriglobia bacterium]
MDCERYQEWIEDAAAEVPAAARHPELKAHVAACPRCRAAFEREQSLVVAIDGSLRATLAAEPSPGFAAGVRAGLFKERVRPRSWLAGWAPVAAGVLAASLLVAAWVGRRQKAEGRKHSAHVASAVTRTNPAPRSGRRQRQVEVRNQKPGVTRGRTQGRLLVAANRRRRSAAGPGLEVLVPKRQAAAVMQLYNSVWVSDRELAAVVARGPEAASELAPISSRLAPISSGSSGLAPKPLEIKPLETPPLDAELQPLSAPDDAMDRSDR